MHVESQYNITAIVSVGENTACGTTIPAWDCSTPVGSTATIVSQDYSYNTLIISLQQGCVTGGAVTFQASIDGVNWFDITGWSPGNLAPIGPIYALQANTYVTAGGHLKPDNKAMLLVTPLRLHRRQLHRLQAEVGGKRKPYGSTHSIGFKRGSLVRHLKHGLTYVGGELKGRISLHSLETGKRLCQNALPAETKFLANSTWRAHSSVA